jgi:hypothetical protein
MALVFVTGAALNLTLQKYIPWLQQRFPGIDVYATINAFLWTVTATLLLLAVIRPLVSRNYAGVGSQRIACNNPDRFVL